MRHSILLLLLCVVLAPAAPAHPIDADKQVQPVAQQERAGRVPDRCLPAGFPTRFDDLIRRAWLKHNKSDRAPFWCGFRAQLAKESSLGARGVDIRSHADAVGIGQLLSSAAKDCRGGGLIGKRVNPQFNISCSAWIMNRNAKIWRSHRTERCRLVLARVSYVSGAGWPIRGQRIARSKGLVATCWEDGIREGMKEVLSERSYRDAVDYVESIDELERRMTP